MSTNDYVKFVTQQIVSYMDQPKEVRKEQRNKRKTERASLVNTLFGVIPFGITLLFKKRK